MAPFQQSSWNSFDLFRADMSLAPPNQQPAPMSVVTIYSLHPGAGLDFTAAIKKINDALGKADWPKTSSWLELVNGGDTPTFVLLNGRQNWAEFAPREKSVRDVLNDAYGKEATDQIYKTIRDSTAHISTETATFRSDLSYLPGK